MIIEMTGLDAPELAVYSRLTEAQLRNRLHPEAGVVIAESPKVIRTALDSGLEPLSLLMERRHITGDAANVIERCGDIPVYTGGREELAGLTGYELTRGVLCAMRRPALPDPAELLAASRRVAVLEGVVDATNIGAIFRSAAALGVDAVLLTPTCCDPFTRRAARVSMGTVFQLPWTYIVPTAADWPGRGMELLRSAGFRTAAMALTDESIPIDDPRPAAEPRLALILGTEGDGLARSTVASCDYTLKIPMSRGVDSLNVAAASAVGFWAVLHGKMSQ